MIENVDIGEYGDLFDADSIKLARKEAEEKARDWSSDDIAMLRRKCKNDLFFLARGPLEYTELSPKFHGHLTGWMAQTRNAQYRMELLPRGHYKSTLSTISESIQMALPNDAGILEHPYCLGPNVTLLISHEVRERAADFLYEIAAGFTRKPGMLALYPELIPSKNVQRINKWQLELPRDEFPKEATFNTIGAGGAAQGGHFHWLKLDDIIGEKARDSETIMRTNLNWFDNILSLLGASSLEVDGFDLTGTRWAYSDTYSHAMDRYGIDVENSVLNCIGEKEIEKFKGGMLNVYARGAIENEVPVFEEQFSLKRLAVLRKNRLVWAAQYANNPQESGLNEFPWRLKFYNTDNRDNIVVFTGDGSFRRHQNELDIVVLTDPSMGETPGADETGIMVVGVDFRFNIFILETIKKRLLPPAYVDELFRLHFKYTPRAITIEEVNFSAIYKYWIEEKSTNMGVYPPIRAYKPGNQRSKPARVRGLSHLFSAGQVYCHEQMHDFRDEYEQFPMGKGYHLLDALAQGPEFWQKGLSQNELDHQKAIVDDIMNDRSAVTGY